MTKTSQLYDIAVMIYHGGLYRHRNDPHHRNDLCHRNDPQSPPKWCFLYFPLFRIVFAWINKEFGIDSKVPSPFKPRFRKFMTGSFRLQIGIISVVNGGHFGGRDHFDGGDHFGGGTWVPLLNYQFLVFAIILMKITWKTCKWKQEIVFLLKVMTKTS